jgi:hypothetical protein
MSEKNIYRITVYCTGTGVGIGVPAMFDDDADDENANEPLDED